MSLYEELDEAVVIPDYQLVLKDIKSLNEFLQTLKYAHECTPLLKAELMGKQRLSTISRIYGRYRKLLPKRDYEIMYRWRLQWERERKK